MNKIKKTTLIALSLLITGPTFAQIGNGLTTYDKESLPSLRLSVDAPFDEVEDAWEDYWDDRYDINLDKVEKDRNGIAYRNEQINLPLVSRKNINLYSKLIDVDNRTDVALAFAYTSADVVTEQAHPESYRAAEVMLNEFRTTFYTDYFDGMLTEVREELEDARDDSQDDSRDAQKARKKIEKYQEKIADYEEKIKDMREEVGDELESSEEKAARALELQEKLRELERRRAEYLR